MGEVAGGESGAEEGMSDKTSNMILALLYVCILTYLAVFVLGCPAAKKPCCHKFAVMGAR
jgi:hypothetical protein